METEDRQLTEPETVFAWRYLELLDAGYAPQEAEVIAVCMDIDLHEACDLVDRGCPSSLAVAILT
jgi:hypothetical protein